MARDLSFWLRKFESVFFCVLLWPALVCERRWRVIPALLGYLPQRAHDAAGRLAFHADDRADGVVAGRKGADRYGAGGEVAVLRELDRQRHGHQSGSIQRGRELERGDDRHPRDAAVDLEVRERDRFGRELHPWNEAAVAGEAE